MPRSANCGFRYCGCFRRLVRSTSLEKALSSELDVSEAVSLRKEHLEQPLLHLGLRLGGVLADVSVDQVLFLQPGLVLVLTQSLLEEGQQVDMAPERVVFALELSAHVHDDVAELLVQNLGAHFLGELGADGLRGLRDDFQVAERELFQVFERVFGIFLQKVQRLPFEQFPQLETWSRPLWICCFLSLSTNTCASSSPACSTRMRSILSATSTWDSW